jgi:hypothetical protein
MAAFRGGGHERVPWVRTISDIIGLSHLLPTYIFQHVGRETNKVAHQLARRALEGHEWVVMRHDIPSDLRSLVLAKTIGESYSPTHCNMHLSH